MKKLYCRALELMISIMCAYCVLWGAFSLVAFDDALYYREQSAAGVLQTAGISAQTLRALDARLAAYLEYEHVGEASLSVSIDGQHMNAFNPRELTHLSDCKRLVHIARQAALVSLSVLFVLLSLRLFLLGSLRASIRVVWIGFMLPLAALAAFAAWAVLDFSAAFTFFHELLFTNELWLLDPATDLLIRICPAEMFAHMGLRIGALAAAGMGLIPGAYTLIHGIIIRKRSKA